MTATTVDLKKRKYCEMYERGMITAVEFVIRLVDLMLESAHDSERLKLCADLPEPLRREFVDWLTELEVMDYYCRTFAIGDMRTADQRHADAVKRQSLLRRLGPDLRAVLEVEQPEANGQLAETRLAENKMCEVELRPLSEREVAVHRQHFAAFPDAHLAVILRVFPRFSEILKFFDTDAMYWRRQLLLVGAFSASRMVGTIAVQVNAPGQSAELKDYEWDDFVGRFSQQELAAYETWAASLWKTHLLAPDNALTLHSMSVATDYRRKGLASQLIDYAISELSEADRQRLYVETARQGYLVNLFAQHGFRVVKKSWSLSEWLEYGQWGSVLLHYDVTAQINGVRSRLAQFHPVNET